MIVSKNPGKLDDLANIYCKNNQSKTRRLKNYLSSCLKKGIMSRECAKISVFTRDNREAMSIGLWF